PATPSGPTRIKEGIEYTYTTMTTDIDGDGIYYKWDWGDGSYSNWLGPFDSGEAINVSHIWTEKGIYKIRVKAKDTLGFESDWSEPLRVSIPYKFQMRITSIIEKISEWIIQILKTYY
ncbi:MAG: PKD domain-containing protein, partial [Thermoplasmata archaeon]